VRRDRYRRLPTSAPATTESTGPIADKVLASRGVAALVPLALITFLSNYGVRIFPTASLGNILLIVLWGYAAARHRLLDIDIFVMRTAATLLVSVVVVAPIAGALIWVGHAPLGVSGSLVVATLLLSAI